MCSRSRIHIVVGVFTAALFAACAEGGGDGSGHFEVGHPSSGVFSAVNPGSWATSTWPQGANFVA